MAHDMVCLRMRNNVKLSVQMHKAALEYLSVQMHKAALEYLELMRDIHDSSRESGGENMMPLPANRRRTLLSRMKLAWLDRSARQLYGNGAI